MSVEQTTLISLSQVIATVRDKQDLLRLLVDNIRPALGCDDFGLFVVDPDGQHHSDWTVLLPEVDPSEGNVALQAAGLGRHPHPGSVIEANLQRAADGAFIMDFQQEFERHPTYPFFPIALGLGFREALVARLQVGGQPLGVFYANSKESGFFQPAQLPFFQAIADQVAVAVANILANEDILDREREKTALLAITGAISSARSATELLATLREHASRLFTFHDTGILIVEPNGQYHYDLAVTYPGWDDSSGGNQILRELGLVRIAHPGSYVAHVMAELEASGTPQVEHFPTRFQQFDYPYFETLESEGYQEGLVSLLKSGGKTLGTFWLNSVTLDSFQPASFALFQALTDQVAVAVANILATEEILAREQEKTHLLRISEAVARISSRQELLRVIYEHIQPVLPFDNAGLFVFDEEKDLFYEILDEQTSPDALQQQLAHAAELGPWQLSDSPPRSWWMQDAPVIRPFSEEVRLSKGRPWEGQLTAGLAFGLQHTIGGPLFSRGRKLGALCFNSKEADFYSEAHLFLFRSISDQLAVAVANILATEEILAREQEKTVLLAISEAITAVRGKEDLLQVILTTIRPLLSFYDCGIIIVDKDRQRYQDLAAIHPQIDGSPANQHLSQAGFYHTGGLPYPGSGVEWLVKALTAGGGPLLFDYQADHSAFTDAPLLRTLKEMGYVEGLAALLKSGGEVFGCFMVNAVQPDQFQPAQFALFQAITDQLSVAVANILANEDILARGAEKALLFDVAQAIATVKDKKTLLATVFRLLRPVIEFEDLGLGVLDPDGQYHTDWATAWPEVFDSAVNTLMHEQQLVRLPFPGTLLEYTFQQVEAAGQPLVIPITEALARQWPEAVYLPVEIAEGLRECLFTTLKTGGRVLGSLNLNSKRAGYFATTDLKLFQAIADQIAVAVANILANEEIMAREREKTKLLEITELIAQVKATDDLLRLIVDKIKPLFRFHDCGLFVVSADGLTHTDLAAVLPDVSPSEWNAAIAAVSANIPHPGSLVEWAMAEMAAANKPVLFDFVDLVARFPTYPQLAGAGILKLGYRDCLAVNLTVRGQPIGFFCVNALQKDFFQPATFPLFQAIGHAVAIAVGNIRAHEEIVAREREKATLLEITEELSRSTNRFDVLRVVYDQLHRLLPFDGSGLFVVNESADSHQLLIHSDQAGGDPAFPIGTAAPMPYRGSAAEWMAQRVAVTPLRKLMRRFPDHPHYPDLQAAGIVELLHGPLTSNGRVMGMFCLNARLANTYTPEHVRLFRHVADQLSVAVANILANEEIVEQTQEMELLLSLSEDMATIREREDLWRVMTARIKPLIPFDDAVVAVFTGEGKCCNHILTVSPAERVNNPNYAKVVNQNVPIAGTPYEYLLTKPKHHLFPIEELVTDYGDFPGVQLMLETGLRYTWHVKLNWAGETIGFVHFHFAHQEQVNQVRHSLVNSIADQMAVAAANILGNEKIVAREKEKTELLNISSAIASIRDKQDLFSVITDIIRPILPFEHAAHIFSIDHENGTIGIFLRNTTEEIAADPEYQLFSQHRFPIKGSPFEEILATGSIFLVDAEVMAKRYPTYRGFALMNRMQLRQSVVVPLRHAGLTIGTFHFFNSQKNFFNSGHFPLLQGIADQIAVAVSNILANEKLQEREREKTELLAISEQLATIRDEQELFAMLFERLAPALRFDDAVLALYDEPGERVSYLQHADVAALDRQQSAAYRQLMTSPYLPAAGTPFADFATYAAPRTVPLAEMQARYPAFPGVQVMRDFGLVESGVLPLRYGGQLLGVLLFHYREAGRFNANHVPFCRNLADQVAVALANLRATTALASQAREKALQVAVTEALHRTDAWNARLLAVARTLQDFVPFDFAGLGVYPALAPAQGGVSNFRRVGFDEYQVLDAEALARISGLPLDKLEALRQTAMQRSEPGPARRLAGDELVAFNRQHPFQGLVSRAFELSSNLKAVVPLARGYFIFSFYSRQPDVYTAAHERLLNSLTGVFADTVEKLLAYDEIEQLKERLELEKEYLEEEIQNTYDFTGIVGKAATLQEAFEQASRVAATDATVLLLGETGTGKELFARALHHASPRRNKLMVKLNCAALPAQLVESELFGHEKGAFTGAVDRRIGKFELADGGTLFLDEVGELPLEVQPKLLRALQEREFERLGSNKTIRVNVRLVAATNRNLEEEVAEGRFRADFYYRLHVFPLVLPPLRERDGDVDLLVRFFLQKFGARYGRPGRTFSAEALRQMRAYGWPGNVRELEHLVEQALLSNRPTDRELGLPRALAQGVRPAPAPLEAPVQTWQDAERSNILAALRQAGGRVRGPGGAAELLAINANTLDSRIAKLGIVKAYSAVYG